MERQAEIDIGYDYRFERQWGRFEGLVWAGFILFLVAGLLGFLGRGPLNIVKRKLSDGTVVQYERVVRFKTPTMVSFTIPASDGIARIEADKVSAQKLGLKQVFPQPTQDFGSDGVGPVQFQVARPDTQTVFAQFSMEPGGVGRVTSNYRINGQTTIQIKQFILP